MLEAYKGKKKAWIKTKQGIKQEKKSKTQFMVQEQEQEI